MGKSPEIGPDWGGDIYADPSADAEPYVTDALAAALATQWEEEDPGPPEAVDEAEEIDRPPPELLDEPLSKGWESFNEFCEQSAEAFKKWVVEKGIETVAVGIAGPTGAMAVKGTKLIVKIVQWEQATEGERGVDVTVPLVDLGPGVELDASVHLQERSTGESPITVFCAPSEGPEVGVVAIGDWAVSPGDRYDDADRDGASHEGAAEHAHVPGDDADGTEAPVGAADVRRRESGPPPAYKGDGRDEEWSEEFDPAPRLARRVGEPIGRDGPAGGRVDCERDGGRHHRERPAGSDILEPAQVHPVQLLGPGGQVAVVMADLPSPLREAGPAAAVVVMRDLAARKLRHWLLRARDGLDQAGVGLVIYYDHAVEAAVWVWPQDAGELPWHLRIGPDAAGRLSFEVVENPDAYRSKGKAMPFVKALRGPRVHNE